MKLSYMGWHAVKSIKQPYPKFEFNSPILFSSNDHNYTICTGNIFSVMVIIRGNETGDPSSNLGQSCLHFTSR